MEPAETLTRRARDWERLSREVQAELGQLRRTASLRAEADALAALATKAVQLVSEQHEAVRAELLQHGRVLPVDVSTLIEAERRRAAYGMTLPDAVMLACVLLECAAFPAKRSVFVNKNTKDFADPGIRDELQHVGCKFIGSFADGLAHVESWIRTAPTGGLEPAAGPRTVTAS